MNFENATDNIKEQINTRLEDATTAASEKVNGALNTAGEKISEAGAQLWEKAPEGRLGDAVGAAAAQVESAGEFLADATVEEIGKDLAGFVRKHPLQSLAAGLVVGGLIGVAYSRLRGALRA